MGRLASCFLTGSVGAAIGYGIDLATNGAERFDVKMLLMLMSLVPVAVISLIYNWGLIVYPLCLLVSFAYMRMELSPRWLLIPLVLVAWDVATYGRGPG